MSWRCDWFGHAWLTERHGRWGRLDWSAFLRPHRQRCRRCGEERTV